jgi:PAS domain S-box-containing protein
MFYLAENKFNHTECHADNYSCRHAEERLESYEAFLNAILENIPDMIFVKDAKDLRFVRFNKAGEELLGYSKGDLYGKNDYEFFSKDEADFFVQKDREVLKSKKLLDIAEEKILTRYNGERILHTKKIPIMNKNGEPQYLLGISQDITDRKKAEYALRQCEKITSTSKDLMSLLDKKYVYRAVNKAYLDAFQKKREEIVGYSASDLLGEEVFTKKIKDKLDLCLAGEEIHDRDWFNLPGLGKRYMEVSYCPYKDDDNSISGIVVNARDITRTFRLESKLLQAQKMEAIGTLAGGIAHDFNNILFPIVGFAEMAMYDLPEDSPLRENLNEILQGATRAGELVKQILTFSRQSNRELKPLELQLVIKEVLKLSRSTLPSTIQIIQDISANCGQVVADSIQIHQIIMNLITNSFHAMQDTGGKLEVTLKEVELETVDLKGKAIPPGSYACLTVADFGIGMQKAVLERIFDPYFTTKEKDDGTGLGLSVVHGIVKGYGGDISVYSEPGVGTTFHIYLPIIKTKLKMKKKKTTASCMGGKERILLVDDEEPIIRMEKQLLEGLGYRVIAENSSSHALELFRSDPGKFDLVITDMTMPDMTGEGLSQKLLEIRPDIPIIICSGFSDKINGEKAAAIGISGYIMKPMIMSELDRKIRNALDQKSISK